jgi:hypothetical protein
VDEIALIEKERGYLITKKPDGKGKGKEVTPPVSPLGESRGSDLLLSETNAIVEN